VHGSAVSAQRAVKIRSPRGRRTHRMLLEERIRWCGYPIAAFSAARTSSPRTRAPPKTMPWVVDAREFRDAAMGAGSAYGC